jgi:hypothetical protein
VTLLTIITYSLKPHEVKLQSTSQQRETTAGRVIQIIVGTISYYWTKQIHGAESFLTIWWSLSWSGSWFSLLCSQKPITSPSPLADVYFNIMLLSTPSCLMWSEFATKILNAFLISYTCFICLFSPINFGSVVFIFDGGPHFTICTRRASNLRSFLNVYRKIK